MSAFDGDHDLEDIAVRDTRVSDAIDEPMRAMILDILADDALTASDVHDLLADRGIECTENTVRHHINELRDAGLVDVVRFEEGRGGTTKYYGANTIVLSYSLPESAESAVGDMTDAVQPQIESALDTLTEEYADAIDEITAEMHPCDHCRTQKYETYVLLTVLRRAFVRALREECGPRRVLVADGDGVALRGDAAPDQRMPGRTTIPCCWTNASPTRCQDRGERRAGPGGATCLRWRTGTTSSGKHRQRLPRAGSGNRRPT